MIDCEKIRLIEDHHEAYYLWKKENLKNKTLVHIDAHIDFGFHDVKTPEQIFKEARTKIELKRELERLLLFKRFQFQERTLTNIGNYIYPAMRDGMVAKFYWVIPGRRKEFKSSLKSLKNMLKGFIRMDPYKNKDVEINDYSIKATIYNIPFFIMTLEDLPRIEDDALLDIDVDYLVTPLLKVANSTDEIGRKSPWIFPSDLVCTLEDRIQNPIYTTVCYSVNGGFTPMKYKFLGDEIHLRLKDKLIPEADEILTERQKAKNLRDWEILKKRTNDYDGFDTQLKKKFLADIFFNIFVLNPKREFYSQAVRLNPSYGTRDNNYGPLYLMKGKTKKAEDEFRRILSVDENNIYACIGMGNAYVRRRKFYRAKREFAKALKVKAHLGESLFGLGIAEFHLKDFDKARRLFLRYERREKPNAETRYRLARINELQKKFGSALENYKNALQLGRNDIDIILRMLKILAKRKDAAMLKFIVEWHKRMRRSIRYSKRLSVRNKQFRLVKRFKRQVKKVDRILKELAVAN